MMTPPQKIWMTGIEAGYLLIVFCLPLSRDDPKKREGNAARPQGSAKRLTKPPAKGI
jgi:hypothetical protein